MHAVVDGEYGGSAHVEDLPSPGVQSGQVRIKVLAAGMFWVMESIRLDLGFGSQVHP